MEYKLIIHPDVYLNPNTFLSMKFETLVEMNAASNACANMLLFLQDDAKLMPDRANMFVLTRLVDGEYIEINSDGELESG